MIPHVILIGHNKRLSSGLQTCPKVGWCFLNEPAIQGLHPLHPLAQLDFMRGVCEGCLFEVHHYGKPIWGSGLGAPMIVVNLKPLQSLNILNP